MKHTNKFQLGKVLTISFAHMLHDIYSSFLSPILPLLIKKLHIGYTLAGSLSTIQRIPSLFNPIVGIIADKVSVRYFIIISPSITAASMSLLGIAPHYGALAILLFVMGISATLFHVPAPVMIKHVSGNRIGKGMSFYMLGGELARTIGPLIILGAVSLWGLEGTYRLIPFGIITSMLLYFRVRKIKISDDLKQDKNKKGINRTFTNLLPFFLKLAGFTGSRALMKAAFTTFLPVYLTGKGQSLWIGGISLAILQFAGAAGTLFCGSISDKIGRKTTLLVISTASPILVWFFLLLDGIIVIPLLILIGIFLFAPNPVILALVQDIASDRPAFTNSIYMTLSFLIAAISVTLIGILGDFIGLEKTFKISGLLAFFAFPFVLKLKK